MNSYNLTGRRLARHNEISARQHCGIDIAGLDLDGNLVLVSHGGSVRSRPLTEREFPCVVLARLVQTMLTAADIYRTDDWRDSGCPQVGTWQLARALDGMMHKRPDLRELRDLSAELANLCGIDN
jgi:hypothetical protein